MLGLAIRFDLGRYHANPWGSHVNDAASEWPPSPWRLLRALYATSRTHTHLTGRQPAVDRALRALAAAPPPIFDLPHAVSAHTRHYMPKATFSAVRTGDTAMVIDGFLAVPRDEELVAWWNVELDADATDALAETALRLGYLGRSESVCTARLVLDGHPRRRSAEPLDAASEPADGSDVVDLLCPVEGPIDALTMSVTELRQQRRLVPPGTRRVTYEVRAPAFERAPARSLSPPALAMFRISGPDRPGIIEAVAVGQALRKALQSRYGDGNDGAASETFSGRRGDAPRGDQHRHAHYLALPDRDGKRVDRLVVWAPEDFQAEELAALTALSFITMREHGRIAVALGAVGSPADLDLPDLLGPARAWKSITPFGLTRHPKRRGGRLVDGPEDQVRRELAHRGLPVPDEVELLPGSWHRFRSSKVQESRRDRARVFGVRIVFPEPPTNKQPIAIGALSHYGLGLMVPAD